MFHYEHAISLYNAKVYRMLRRGMSFATTGLFKGYLRESFGAADYIAKNIAMSVSAELPPICDLDYYCICAAYQAFR